jgi:hypothetical protein
LLPELGHWYSGISVRIGGGGGVTAGTSWKGMATMMFG